VPDAGEVRRIAASFRESGYEIRVALRGLLTSDAFYSMDNRGALVKSPVDLVIGTARQFNVAYADARPIALLLRTLGQDLFSPPNVKGWAGGEAWINSTTLLARRQFTERLFRVDENRMQGPMGEMNAKGIEQVLLALPVVVDDADGLLGIDRIRRITADPAYQLK
jgi:uncharacterized protein (DUF1800 family)